MAKGGGAGGGAKFSWCTVGIVMSAKGELILAAAAFLLAVQLASSTHVEGERGGSSDAVSRTQLTLNGVLDYYWKSDPNNKKIEFLFACGQLGLMGAGNQGQCSCFAPSACVNCYRWWTAVMVESVATYGIYMNTSNHSSLPDMVYSHSPYNDKWDPAVVTTCTYIDDFLWYGIAYLRVYDWLSVSCHIYGTCMWVKESP